VQAFPCQCTFRRTTHPVSAPSFPSRFLAFCILINLSSHVLSMLEQISQFPPSTTLQYG
jgi:hypothetical protein